MRAFLVSLVVGMAALVAIPGISAQRGGSGGAEAPPSVRGAGSSDPAAIRAVEQSLRWSLEAGRRRDSRCEGSDRAGPQRRQRRPFRLHHLRPGRLHGRHDCLVQAAGVSGQSLDAGRSAGRHDLVQLVLGIVRGERGPRHRHASDVWRGQPVVRGDGPGAWIHLFRQPADAAAAEPGQRRSAVAHVGAGARPAESHADAPEVDRLLEADQPRAPQRRRARCPRRIPA